MRASQEELIIIKKVMDSEKKVRVLVRVFRRYQALYLYLSGKTCEETAAIVSINKNTVSNINTIIIYANISQDLNAIFSSEEMFKLWQNYQKKFPHAGKFKLNVIYCY